MNRPMARRSYRGRDSAQNVLMHAIWLERENSSPKIFIVREGRERGMVISIHAHMGVRRIHRSLRRLNPQIRLESDLSSLMIAALIRGTIRGRDLANIQVTDELKKRLAPHGLRAF